MWDTLTRYGQEHKKKDRILPFLGTLCTSYTFFVVTNKYFVGANLYFVRTN